MTQTTMDSPTHLTAAELEAGLDFIAESPRNAGRLEAIVRRPGVDDREELDEATLDEHTGLVGDSWIVRASSLTSDRSPHPEMQLTLMNSRVIALLAQSRERWALAGDQFYVDLDLGLANLPPGARLQIGEAVVEVTAQPHLGCAKFASRFGRDALLFVNAQERRHLRLRGVNARVIRSGAVKAGDVVRVIR